MKSQNDLFRQALIENRPVFIEYFLNAGFEPLRVVDERNRLGFLRELYADIYKDFKKVY